MSAPHISNPAKVIEQMHDKIADHESAIAQSADMPHVVKAHKKSIAACKSVISKCVAMMEAMP